MGRGGRGDRGKEGRDEIGAGRGRRGKKKERKGEISPPRSFLKVGTYGLHHAVKCVTGAEEHSIARGTKTTHIVTDHCDVTYPHDDAPPCSQFS